MPVPPVPSSPKQSPGVSSLNLPRTVGDRFVTLLTDEELGRGWQVAEPGQVLGESL